MTPCQVARVWPRRNPPRMDKRLSREIEAANSSKESYLCTLREMESVDLDMGDVFGEERGDDEDMGAVGTLPDLPEATQDPDNDEDNAEVLQRLKDLSKGAAKKVIRRPQPKLDPTRLTGERGIPILPKLGEKIKFKGKGHEAEDLGVLMRCMEHWAHRLFPSMTFEEVVERVERLGAKKEAEDLGVLMRCMEHWAHRLFPRMPFDEVVERVERLGAKKEVQTCVKKMRLDMPILDQDFVGSDRGSGDEEEGVNRGSDGEEEQQPKRTMDLDAEWEELMREEDEVRASQAPPPATPTRGAGHSSSSSQPAPSTSGGGGAPATPKTQAPTAQSTASPGLTAEQLERIEKNKQLARERKLRKLGIASPAPASTRPAATSASPASQQSQSAGDKTVSQSSQAGNTQNQSTPSQTVSQSRQDTQSESGSNLATQSDRTQTETYTSQTQNNGDSEEQMSEVTRRSNIEDMILQDAQERFTATAISSQDLLNSEKDTGASQSQMVSEGTESKANTIEDSEEMSEVIEKQDNGNTIEDSEEMSEVIEKQDNGNIEALRPTQVPLVNGTVTDSMDEMSEVIDKQDALVKKTVNMEESEEDKENLTLGAGNAGCLKQKSVVAQNHSDSPKDVVPDIEDELNDNMNEEELMDILDQ